MSAVTLDDRLGTRWKKPPLITNSDAALGPDPRCADLSGAGGHCSLDVNWARVAEGLSRGWAFVTSFFNPDFVSRGGHLGRHPRKRDHHHHLDHCRHRDLDPDRTGSRAQHRAVAGLSHLPGIVALSRALNEIIVAILLVAIFGFGPLAGFLTLSFATIGFLSKLLAEDIEEMDRVQAEAIRATGASWLQWINYGVQPQVMPRLIGLSMYRLDINFRESAVLGLVGAGGIGATLNTAFDRYEFDTAAAILLIIIVTVMVLEYLSGIIRAKVQ
jgi:phosphonate transport system permease protein